MNEKVLQCETSLEDLKEALQGAAKHMFGKRNENKEVWFDNQDLEIQVLLKEKLKTGDKRRLTEEIRRMKYQWFWQKAEERITESSVQLSVLFTVQNLETYIQ